MSSPLLDLHIDSVQNAGRQWDGGRSDYSGGITDSVGGPNFAAIRRPYFDKNGRPAVTVNTGRWTTQDSRGGERRQIKEHVLLRDLPDVIGYQSPVANATTLRKEEWLELDRQVLRAARFRLRAYADLSAANSYGGFNGMSKLILEHETMSDPGEAIVDMDALTEGRTDAPQFQLEGLPLPITHSDFWFSSRRLAVSRNTGTPLDMTQGEAAARRVAESIEKQTIGNNTGVIYGGSSTYAGGYGRTPQVYGYTNFTPRLTYTSVTAPLGTNPEATVANVLAMRDRLYLNKFYGPFMLYHSNDWDQWLDNDYARAVVGATSVATSVTLRERLKAIEGIQDVRRLDFLFASSIQTDNMWNATNVNLGGATGTGLAALTGLPIYRGPGGEGVSITATSPFTLLMIQMTPDVARAVNGMDITTVQWESSGGMRLNFKVLCIQVAQLRADFYGNCGLLHGTTA